MNTSWKYSRWVFLSLALEVIVRGGVVSFVAPRIITRRRNGIAFNPETSKLLLASNNNNKKNLSASERERREEDKRRLERKADVMIGKTSAKLGAKDYALDPSSTQEQWMRQASEEEQIVFKETERGLECLKMLRLEEASQAFENVFQLRPSAYLWQAGIAKFYLGDYVSASEIFAKNARSYESKFGSPASEERIWRDACELKHLRSLSRKERKVLAETGESMIAAVPEGEETVDALLPETRKVLNIARDLFAASVEDDHVKVVLSRAKLRSIGGTFQARPRPDPKMWKAQAWFFLGLHYDVLGGEQESRQCMKMAVRLSPSPGNGVDIIHTLPLIHMSQRDWFDDDDFESDPLTTMGESLDVEFAKHGLTSQRVSSYDPLMIDSIKSSLAQLRFVDIQSALRRQGLKTSGSKEEIQKRLFTSLIDDPDVMAP